MADIITIRRCNGNRLAWVATVGPSDYMISTDIDLGKLIERVWDGEAQHGRIPEFRLIMEPESEIAARAQLHTQRRDRLEFDIDRAKRSIRCARQELRQLA